MNKKIFIILLFTFFSFSLAGNVLAAATLTDPLSGTTPNMLIGKIISAALGIVGSLALLMFIYGGFTWMLASGNAEAVSKGKNILIWATIGLVVIFSSYALVAFVFKGLGLTIT